MWDTHLLGQDLGRFRKLASQLIEHAHIDPIVDFRILVIPVAVFFSSRTFELGTVGTRNRISKISSGFGDYRKLAF